MRLVPRRWRQKDPELIRATIALYEDATHEMVRCTYPSGVSFVGYPKLTKHFVVLYGTDGVPKHTLRLSRIEAVSRVFWANAPKGSKLRKATVPKGWAT